jgi:hypothetical protein
MIGVVRNGQETTFEVEAFWTLAKSRKLLRSDQVRNSAGTLHSVTAYAELLPLLPAEPVKPNLAEGLLKIGLAVAGAYCVVKFLDDLTKPPRPARRPAYLRPPNTEPVEQWKREYVYARDGGRCTYCGVRLSFGRVHVDHSVSRANRGTNHLNNLRTACAPCNLAKGALNGRQFLG